METLVVRPKDENQLAAIKAFMQALNIDFEKQDKLPNYIFDNIERGLKQAKEGEVITMDEFKAKHFIKQ